MKKLIVALLMAFIGLFTSSPIKADVKKHDLPQFETHLLAYAPASNDVIADVSTSLHCMQRSFIEDSSDGGGLSQIESDNSSQNGIIDTIWAFIIDNWEGGIGLSVLLIGALARWIPTTNAKIYIDIIGLLIKLLQSAFPNRKKGGGTHQ